jgi:glycosyltransferase involved in cell wall biosynthesis
MVGFIDQFETDELSRLLGRSWILVNTAAREGLPNAYIEAAAHRCAILSAVDPDGFASKFGYHASKDDFAKGLKTLLKDDLWMSSGQQGYEFVSEVFMCDKAIDQHLAIYNRILSSRKESYP